MDYNVINAYLRIINDPDMAAMQRGPKTPRAGNDYGIFREYNQVKEALILKTPSGVREDPGVIRKSFGFDNRVPLSKLQIQMQEAELRRQRGTGARKVGKPLGWVCQYPRIEEIIPEDITIKVTKDAKRKLDDTINLCWDVYNIPYTVGLIFQTSPFDNWKEREQLQINIHTLAKSKARAKNEIVIEGRFAYRLVDYVQEFSKYREGAILSEIIKAQCDKVSNSAKITSQQKEAYHKPALIQAGFTGKL